MVQLHRLDSSEDSTSASNLMEPHIQLPWYCFVVIGLGWTKRTEGERNQIFVVVCKALICDETGSGPRLQNTQRAINSVEPPNLIPQQVQMQRQNPDIVFLHSQALYSGLSDSVDSITTVLCFLGSSFLLHLAPRLFLHDTNIEVSKETVCRKSGHFGVPNLLRSLSHKKEPRPFL